MGSPRGEFQAVGGWRVPANGRSCKETPEAEWRGRGSRAGEVWGRGGGAEGGGPWAIRRKWPPLSVNRDPVGSPGA